MNYDITFQNAGILLTKLSDVQHHTNNKHFSEKWKKKIIKMSGTISTDETSLQTETIE